jgi:hypothetical protein
MVNLNPNRSGVRRTLAIERTFHFVLHQRVKSAMERNDFVSGAWAPDRTRSLTIDDRFDIIEQFANWSPEPRRIVRFTKAYGPLEAPFKKGGRFRFTIARWIRLQRRYQRRWSEQMFSPDKPLPNMDWEALSTAPGERFEFFSGELSYTVATLYRFLLLGLYACPRWRLAKCGRPECQNPFFVATRRGQKYCSEPCANAAQKEWKRNWWNARGSPRRNKGRRKS